MVWVSIGGVFGHSLCTGVAVIGGRMLASRISVRTGKHLDRPVDTQAGTCNSFIRKQDRLGSHGLDINHVFFLFFSFRSTCNSHPGWCCRIWDLCCRLSLRGHLRRMRGFFIFFVTVFQLPLPTNIQGNLIKYLFFLHNNSFSLTHTLAFPFSLKVECLCGWGSCRARTILTGQSVFQDFWTGNTI